MKSLTDFLPDILTFLRMLGSIILLFLNPTELPFFFVYIFCGLTDTADGFFARKFNCATKHGEIFDSISDFVFLLICVIKLRKIIELPQFVYFWILIIFAVKIINLVVGKIKKNDSVFLHTIFNKITGILLFVFPLTINVLDVRISSVALCIVATVAAVNESFVTIKYKNKSSS